jgi:hypothetical protein
VSLTARVCQHHDQPWMVIEAAPENQGGRPIVVYDGPLNLHSKATTKAEIDWAHERSGVSRADLYDALRLYERSARAIRRPKSSWGAPARTHNLKGAA